MRAFTLTLIGLVILSGVASARGAGGRSETGRLSPGGVGHLHWVEYHKVAAEAAASKKPVMIYLYEGVKTPENVQEMVAAQLRLIPDDKVKEAASSLVCTKVDWMRPDDVRRAADSSSASGVLERDRLDASEDDGEEADESPDLIMEPEEWPQKICLYFLDYRGRPITEIDEITSKRAQFVATVKQVLATNAKRVKADEREEERAARKAAAGAARQAAKQEAAAEEDGGQPAGPEDGEPPEGDLQPGSE